MKATPSAIGAPRWALAVAVASMVLASNRTLDAQAAPPPASRGFSALQGFVTDSVHNTALINATVTIEGTSRTVPVDADGKYRIDSIPAGKHRVLVKHPLLDTLGFVMRTPEYPFGANESHELDLAVPSGERIAGALCTPAQRTRGPAVMVGFVRDPDTNGPALGAKVQLVYQVTDASSHKTSSTTREATVDTLGLYRICGLPADMSGKVQVFRNGVSSGEVPAAVANGIVVRAFSIVSQHQIVAEVTTDSGKVKRIAKGSARVTGKVVDKTGRPLGDARVTLQGGGTTVLTRSNGEFVLDSLPPGTQALVVRKLGYAASESPIELSSTEPLRTTVRLDDFVPTLAVMRVEAAQDKALADIGYLSRKQTGQGFYMDGNMINHQSLAFSDVMRVAPGLRVQPRGDGRTYVITDSRSSTTGCVNYYVDGTLWQTMTPGDIDDFVHPSELVAVEVYHGAQTPPQFTPPGQSSCAAIVAWTVAKVRPKDTKTP
jgi:Carboxypeptidase regulatory-like domain